MSLFFTRNSIMPTEPTHALNQRRRLRRLTTCIDTAEAPVDSEAPELTTTTLSLTRTPRGAPRSLLAVRCKRASFLEIVSLGAVCKLNEAYQRTRRRLLDHRSCNCLSYVE